MEPRDTAGSRALAWSRRLFLPLALVFLAAAAFASRDAFAAVLAQAHPGLLAGLVVAWAASHLLMPAFTWRVLVGLGHGIGYRETLRIHVARLPARYLPGGIWHTVSRMVALRGRGVSAPDLATLVVLEQVVPLAVSLILGGVLAETAGTAIPGAFAAIAGALMLVATPVVLARRPWGAAPAPALPTLAFAVAVFAVFWLLAGALFAIYWRALPAAGVTASPAALMATYLLAWAAGFVSVFAPQGLGVFEAVASAMLGGAAGFAGMAVLVAGFRALTIAGDLLAYASLVCIDAVRGIHRRS